MHDAGAPTPGSGIRLEEPARVNPTGGRVRFDPSATGQAPPGRDIYELDRPTQPQAGVAPHAPLHILVDCSTQRLSLLRGSTLVKAWTVSTSAYGLGSRSGSNKTPPGTHRVAEKFGKGAPLGTIFRARKNTGKVARVFTDRTDVEEDLVLTRILWLEGLEEGRNKGPGVDSKSRFIYVHGTNEEGLIGTPASHGCVRMRNRDVVELYSLVPVGTLVSIQP